MEFYFKAVTLGAFTWRNEDRIALLLEHIRKMGAGWLLLHFLLLTLCLNFPVMYQIARLDPFEFYSRLLSGNNEQRTENNEQGTENNEQRIENNGQRTENSEQRIEDSEQLTENSFAPGFPLPTPDAINEFNQQMSDNNYGRAVLLPILGFSFGLTLIIQIVFYLCAVFFLGLSRMNFTPLPFWERMGLCLFSSTLPVIAAALFGLFLPTVHIIIYYFIIIFFIFQRSKLCPNG